MVIKEDISENLEKAILKKELTDIINKSFLEVVKCSNNRATRAGANAEIHMANNPNGMKVPKRLLQHKGFDEEGNDLGYIVDIDYPSGYKIDYYGGKITFPDGTEYQQDVLDNYKKDSNGNFVHDKEGSAEKLLEYQYKEADGGSANSTKSMLLQIGNLFKSGFWQNYMSNLDKNGIDIMTHLNNNSTMNPKLAQALESYKWMMQHKDDDVTLLDRHNLVTGTQISRSDMTVREASKINTKSQVPLSASVGRLNDKTINVKNDITDETRSLNGKVNNWNNTWKIYTCITQADGTHALYLGYPQNVKAGAWDNSGNMYNDVTYMPNQDFHKLLVDKTNGIIIQVPANSP